MNTIPKHVYMLGIGGIGMSALAQMLVRQGKEVSGADREASPTTDMLEEKGISVSIGEDSRVPEGTETLIYSDALAFDHPGRVHARERHIPELSYFEALGEVSRDMRTIAVAGTHGKTTTTGMLAKVLHVAGKEPTAIIGSIVRDFGSNFLSGKNDVFVVEACEYRDHLLKLNPEILVITNLEHDHTDYFPTLAAIQETFKKAVEKVPAHGAIVTNPSDPNIAPILAGAKARIVDYTLEEVPPLQLVGEFNAMNARAAAAGARAAFFDIAQGTIDRALGDFQGSWRRFEYRGEAKSGMLVYDDYAHHPTAVRKTIAAAREKFPDKKITIAFHPHLFSRTRDLMEDFAQALATADEVILAPIYAAREEPIPGVTSEVLAAKVLALGTPAAALPSLHEIYLYFSASSNLSPGTLLITMGAGDIYKVAEQLVEE